VKTACSSVLVLLSDLDSQDMLLAALPASRIFMCSEPCMSVALNSALDMHVYCTEVKNYYVLLILLIV